MRLDLRRDFDDIYTHLANRVRRFQPTGGDVLGGSGPVKLIEVGYEYAQAGWVVVAFDTRPNAEPDGEWTHTVTDGNMLRRPHWREAGDANCPITLVQLDGTEGEFDAELAEPLGEMIKALLLKARADGVFTGLPKAPGCELGVEHFDGCFGWPVYEERGQDNLVEP